MHIQLIGNYLDSLSEALLEKGIYVENIIDGVNPMAMAGKRNEKYLHYSGEIGTAPVALNVKKNLNQMLSHDENTFESNLQTQREGSEVRYKNSSKYVVVCNSYIAVTLFEDGNSLYSDIWPQNQLTEELKSNNALKRIQFPFPEELNWKFYYDKFIDAIKDEYDADHIILVKINAARWYMKNDSIAAFEPLSKAFKNAVEEIDNYFEERTGCYTTSALYFQIPDNNIRNAFPYEMPAEYIYKLLADDIYDIISGNNQRNVSLPYHAPVVKNMLKRLSQSSIEKLQKDLEKMNSGWISSVEECESGFVSEDIIRLKYFLNPESNNFLSDFLDPLEVLTETQIKEKINITSLYIRYFNVDINDIIAVYKFYCNCTNKADFREIVELLLQKTDWGPVKVCFDFVKKNLDYLKNYKFISSSLLAVEAGNMAYIRVGDKSYIVLDRNSDTIMQLITIKEMRIDCADIISSHYICDILQAEKVCESWKLYIEKARRGEGAAPFKILFSSVQEYEKSLYYIDYTELLNNENFILTTEPAYETEEAHARTDLGFFFKPNVKICSVTSGLADQLAYYVFAEKLGEETNSDIYFYDRIFGFKGSEFYKFTKRDVSGRLMSNLISQKLLKQTYQTNWSLANVLYDNGLKELTMVFGGWCTSNYDKAKCNRMSISNIPSFFKYESDSISYYWSLIRPDEIMEFKPFKLSDYIVFPDFDTNINIEISQKMLSSDSISVHVRRGDFITVGRADDLSFYFNSIKAVLGIEQYKNRKWFIFSDDIPFCKSHTSELGLDLIKDEEIFFIDHNKYEESFRDMQLMTYSKVIVGGNSGFSRMAAIYSSRCEVFVYNVKRVMDLFKRIGKENKYNVDMARGENNAESKQHTVAAPRNYTLPPPV